jgi:alpha-1,2-mannosyltransferase
MPAQAVDETDPRHVPPTWFAGALIFLTAFAVFALTISHTIVSLDVWSANFGSWHLATTGNPWIEGIRIPLLDHSALRHEWVLDAGNGHTVIGRSPGVIAVALPLYWLLQPSAMTTVPGGLTAALLMAGAVTLMYLAIKESLPRRHAALAALAFGFTTPVWSVAANGVWPHTVTVFGIAGMAWAASTGRWWWAGLFGGITLWGRLHAALVVAAFALLVGVGRRRLDIVLKVGLVSALFLALTSLWTHWMYGTWNPTASYDTTVFEDYAKQNRFSVVNQLGFWISPDRGILVWTPVILLLVPAVVRSWRVLPDWSRSMVWGGLAYTLLQGVLNRFSGGDVFYGYRLGLEFLAAATPALALSAPRMGAVARALVGPVLGIQLVAIGFGALKDGAYLPFDQVWHHNAFEVAVRAAGPAAWLALALTAAVSFLAQRVWLDRARSVHER